MKPLPDTAVKVLALAMNDAAYEGERAAALSRFVALLRSHGIAPAELGTGHAPALEKQIWRRFPMPFGKYRGRALMEIDEGYLIWLAGLEDLREPLKTYLARELEYRHHGG
jgi:CHASE2 domain-containing sensor protein